MLIIRCGDCFIDDLKDAIQNDIKIATAKLDSPPFSEYSKDSFFAALDT